jgi:ABC-type transport system involved in multi-copper enzyme maturation permease subunit
VVKLRTITLTAFQETFRRRVFYLVILLSLLIVIMIISEMHFMRMARHAGEATVILDVGRSIMRQIIGIWNFAAFFLAFFLGATAISAEVSAKTIVHILSRPVERWVYLLGRWLGVLIFLWLFISIGIAGALLVSLWLHVPYTPMLWIAIAEVYVSATFYSGLALGFSVVAPPVPAGVLAFLLAILPGIFHDAINDPRLWHRIPALIAYYLGPARMPVDLISDSFAKQRLHTDYSLYLGVLGENLFYVTVVLILAAVFFRRRELRVR